MVVDLSEVVDVESAGHRDPRGGVRRRPRHPVHLVFCQSGERLAWQLKDSGEPVRAALM
jgi:hypothetical protein